uniref:Uncharacterized protein n=1 Tax=Trichogramma kaykai TaxID=54128 RepID=A0ABD2WTS4_9HYME
MSAAGVRSRQVTLAQTPCGINSVQRKRIAAYTTTMHITHSLTPEGLYIYYMESLGIASVILPRQSSDGTATRGRKLASIRCCVQIRSRPSRGVQCTVCSGNSTGDGGGRLESCMSAS